MDVDLQFPCHNILEAHQYQMRNFPYVSSNTTPKLRIDTMFVIFDLRIIFRL
jgi:hypothetical protein